MTQRKKKKPEAGLRNKEWYKKYQRYLRYAGIKIEPLAWIAISVVLAVVFGAATFFLVELLLLEAVILPIIISIVVLDLLLGMPYMKAINRIEDIERMFPDALKQMSDTLRSGSTYESALREVATSDFGALGDEMQNALRKLEEGENFESALRVLSERVESVLVRRVVAIIIDAVRAGAALADVLDEIAEDAREGYRVKAERKTKTLLQTMFIVAAGIIIAPFIFGMVSEIVRFLINTAVGSGVVTSREVAQNAYAARDTIALFMQIYLFVQVLASSLMIAIMREGRASKSIIYFPFLLLLAFIIFYASQFGIMALLSQVGGTVIGG